MSQTSAQLLADSLGTASTGTIPIGGIILWSGSTGTIPTGWALCNGSNGTPNLQDRFVVGAGSGYAVDATGGSNTVSIETTNLPSHTHDSGSYETTENGSHRHTYKHHRSSTSLDNDEGNSCIYSSLDTYSTGPEGEHKHWIEGTSGNVTGSTGSATPFDIIPKYYALAFIQRIS